MLHPSAYLIPQYKPSEPPKAIQPSQTNQIAHQYYNNQHETVNHSTQSASGSIPIPQTNGFHSDKGEV